VAENLHDLDDTWNSASTTYNALKINVTDTTSAAASKLYDFQVGGTTKGNLRKDGLLYTIAMLIPEGSEPNAPTNGVILWAKDNGSGKTQLMARFPTGASVALSTEA
jgi:hypothetical protein